MTIGPNSRELWNAAIIFGVVLALILVLGVWGTIIIKNRATDPTRYDTRTYESDGKLIVEIRPRGRRLYPFVLLVPAAEREKLLSVGWGPSGRPPEVALVLDPKEIKVDGEFAGLQIGNVVDPANSAFGYFSTPPSSMIFGQRGEKLWIKSTPGGA